ncbi:hypothetical protein SCG7086_BX_00090 [Chlamydiales bacterium SCGC AG-110-P3]|nr:hypothetical protein SCG7086_BX_00090 [Chlamydiales bacterium SCGC AG-110-P3]
MEEIIKENLKQMSQCYDVILDVTCEAVMENSKKGYHSELEPWEVFEARTRAKMKKNVQLLQTRFSEGYTAVMGEIVGTEMVKVRRKPEGPSTGPTGEQ